MPNPCERLDHALQLLVSAMQAAENNIDTSIEVWKSLRLTYKEVHEGSREGVSFESWGLANIDAFLIKRIGEWIHTAHFESLSDPKKTELLKTAKAFNTDIWMIYFILGEGLIAKSVKGLKRILRCRRVLKDLTLETLRNELETAREKRRGIRSRNVSNDMTKFTLSDVKRCELALCPMPLSPPPSDRNSVPLDPGFLPATPNPRTPALRLGSPQTPLERDESDGGNDIDIEHGWPAPVFNTSFSSDVGKHGIFSTPQIGDEYAQLLSTPQSYVHIEPSPSLSGSSDDGSEESIGGILEQDDGLFSDDIDQDASSDFDMEIPEKGSERLSRMWGKPGGLLTYKRFAVLENRHLREFDGDERLTDETVNYFMKSLLESSAITSKVFTQPSFFYENLQRGSRNTIDQESVSRWPEKQGCVSLDDAEYLVLPIYEETIQHWLLVIAGNMTPGRRVLAEATADVQGPTAFVTVIDSLGSRAGNMRVAEDIRSYICLEACAKLNIEFDQSRIEIKLPKQALRQNNDKDCGIYVLEHTRRFLANPAAFLQRIFCGRLATAFDVAMMRAQLAGGIIQDKQQQDLDDEDVGIQRDAINSRADRLERKLTMETRDPDAEKEGRGTDANIISDQHQSSIDNRKPASCTCRRLLDHESMDQNSQYKRRRTEPHSPDLTMDEVSPQMIVRMIVTTKQLTQLATVPLLQNHGQQDLVDSKIWRVLQSSITRLALQSDPVTDPINIIKDMGFPCVTHLSGAFPHFISADSASDEEETHSENHSYLQCLSDYASSAERAIASAQVLRELFRRSENAVQSLQMEYENDIEHLKKYAPPPSAIRYHIQANADKEMALLLRSLQVLFESTQNIVSELKEYRLQVQVAQKSV